jgi:hypothetical protein
MAVVRSLQTCTVAAALFALLGACGLVPPGPARPVQRPRRPGSAATIRGLTGTWEATIRIADGRMPLVLTVLQSGDALTGELAFPDRPWPSRAAPAVHIDATGRVVLVFGPSPQIVLRGRAAHDAAYISAWVEGLGRQPALIDFFRR